MPIHELDPWRLQYFADVPCPDDVHIPTEDADAWAWYPAQRWIYNKLEIAESQELPCGPHGVEPPGYPVFSKPICNMRGMGADSRVIHSAREYAGCLRPGHMWMPLLEGEHVSSDCAVVSGEPRWWRHALGQPSGGGTFDHWTVLAGQRPEIEAYAGDWVRKRLEGYTGIVNLETIGTRIIEAHLRFADQWPDLYGAGWVEALVRLYAKAVWSFDDRERREGYSVVLFGAHGPRYHHPPPELLDALRAMPGISSVQITFHEDRPSEAHAMPPGGFRLAIVNCWHLQSGFEAREKLALALWSAQELGPSRGRRRRRTHGARQG
jgi:hypothetical protein